jgi:Na+-transporting methylmalonyl-CoA/oxaloacetate decarboxylase gamma subunit
VLLVAVMAAMGRLLQQVVGKQIQVQAVAVVAVVLEQAATVVLVSSSFVGLHHNKHQLPQQEALR